MYIAEYVEFCFRWYQLYNYLSEYGGKIDEIGGDSFEIFYHGGWGEKD